VYCDGYILYCCFINHVTGIFICAEVRGILDLARAVYVGNDGHSVCMVKAFLQGKNLPKRNRGQRDVFNEVADIMTLMTQSQNLHELSDAARSIVRQWTPENIKKLSKMRQSLPPEAAWDLELVFFYVSFFEPDYEVLFFRASGDYLILLESPSFSTSKADKVFSMKKPVFIVQRERDGHCRAMTSYDGSYDVSTLFYFIVYFYCPMY
jgi:hypothetical protein